jgi:hypothetical protein
MPDKPKLEEQALSEAAELSISAQLDEVEALDVAVETDWLKMLQGKADSVSLTAQGVVVQKSIRLHEMQLYADGIAIDLLHSAIFGQVELEEPIDVSARLVLTEQDINRALNTDYIRQKFQRPQINVEGRIVTLELQEITVNFPTASKMGINATILLHEFGKSEQFGFSGVMCLGTAQQPLLLEKFDCIQGGGISLDLAIAVLHKAKELLNMPYFQIDGMRLNFKKLDIEDGKLTLYTAAHIQQFPDLKVQD